MSTGGESTRTGFNLNEESMTNAMADENQLPFSPTSETIRLFESIGVDSQASGSATRTEEATKLDQAAPNVYGNHAIEDAIPTKITVNSAHPFFETQYNWEEIVRCCNELGYCVDHVIAKMGHNPHLYDWASLGELFGMNGAAYLVHPTPFTNSTKSFEDGQTFYEWLDENFRPDKTPAPCLCAAQDQASADQRSRDVAQEEVADAALTAVPGGDSTSSIDRIRGNEPAFWRVVFGDSVDSDLMGSAAESSRTTAIAETCLEAAFSSSPPFSPPSPSSSIGTLVQGAGSPGTPNADYPSAWPTASPGYPPSSPTLYQASSPRDTGASPNYSGTSPSNSQSSAVDQANSPTLSTSNRSYSPSSPPYSPSSPTPYQPLAASPTYSTASPLYSPDSPTPYQPPSLGYTGASPNYSGTSPFYSQSSSVHQAYSPTIASASPEYSTTSPSYSPGSPIHEAYSPTFAPVSPDYHPTSPSYSPGSPVHEAYSPTFAPVSPNYHPTSPSYSPSSPVHEAYSLTIAPASPEYHATSPSYPPGSPRDSSNSS